MPATIYYTDTTYMEQDYGLVTERTVVSDTYAGLFAGGGTACNILIIKKDKSDANFDTNQYKEDQLNFSINSAECETPTDWTVYDFVMDAQSVDVSRYIAHFLMPAATLTVNEATFVGIIQPEMKAVELTWENRDEYDPDTQPIYEWDITAKSFTLSSFDSDSIHDLCLNTTDGLITQTAWKAANIADRLGYVDLGTINGIARKGVFCNLVNLNTALRKIADILEARMTTRLGQTFNIVFDTATLDVTYSPARWYNLVVGKRTPADGVYHWMVTRFLGEHSTPSRGRTFLDAYYDDTLWYLIDDADAIQIEMGDSATDASSIWVSSLLFMPEDYNFSGDGEDTTIAHDGSPQSKDCSFVSSEETTFADFLIGLGASLGLMVSFYYTTATELHVSWTPRQNYEKEMVYIPDVLDSDIDVHPYTENQKESLMYYGNACDYANEGEAEYYVTDITVKDGAFADDSTQGSYSRSAPERITLKGSNRALLTISPTIRHQTWNDECDFDGLSPGGTWLNNFKQLQHWLNPRMPHNAAFQNDGARKNDREWDDALWNSAGLHTAIYVKTTGIETSKGPLSDGSTLYNGYGLQDAEIWTPAGRGHYIYNGVTFHIKTQSEYLNAIQKIVERAYETERNLTVPYLCRFRKAQDGTDTDDDGGRGRWQNLQLGSKIRFGLYPETHVDYLVVGIERDYVKHQTILKLWDVSNYSFTRSTGLANSTDTQSEIPKTIVMPATQSTQKSVASGIVTKHNVLMLNSDGTVSRAVPHSDYIGTFCGLAANSADDGEEVMIIPPGCTVFDPDKWLFTVKTPLYLRKALTSADNIVSSLLITPSLAENVVMLVGYGLPNGSIETIDFNLLSNQLILGNNG